MTALAPEAPPSAPPPGDWPRGKPLYVTPPPVDVPGVWFDEVAVDKVLRALRALRHTKGKWAGLPFEPDAWQIEWIIRPIFGWKYADGTRVVRTVWVECPRKNGKSSLAAGFALVLLAADSEQGAEVYSAAVDREQARIVFDEAKRMAERSPVLNKGLKIMRNRIESPRTNGTYRALSRIAEAAHGLNVHGALVDEVHVHKSRDLIDALETGTGAREQPLIIFITTADEGEQTTIYAEKHDYAVNLANGQFRDPSFYGVIWAADEQDDPFAVETWYKANPALGISISEDFIRKEAERARQTPTFYASFLRLYLNRRVRIQKRYIPLQKWDESAGVVDPEKLVGRTCYGGLDLSSTTDLTAFALVFPSDDLESCDILTWLWMPADNVAEREREDKVPYSVWIRQGYITATEGNVVDYDHVEKVIKEASEKYKLKEVSYDRWNAGETVTHLMGEGITMIPMGQGFASMTAPTKDLLKRVLGGKLHHGGNPVLRWMADNMVVATDAAENVKPEKTKSTARIDGIVAIIMGLDRILRQEPRHISVYSRRGLMVLGDDEP